MNHFDTLKDNTDLFIKYMMEKYPVYNKSNIFLRDIQYGIKNFFEKKAVKLTYSETEKVSALFIKHIEDLGIIEKLNYQTWRFNYFIEEKLDTSPQETAAE